MKASRGLLLLALALALATPARAATYTIWVAWSPVNATNGDAIVKYQLDWRLAETDPIGEHVIDDIAPDIDIIDGRAAVSHLFVTDACRPFWITIRACDATQCGHWQPLALQLRGAVPYRDGEAGGETYCDGSPAFPPPESVGQAWRPDRLFQ